MKSRAEDDWAEEAAKENECSELGSLSATPSRFGTPTPSQKRTPVARPVTPTRERRGAEQ